MSKLFGIPLTQDKIAFLDEEDYHRLKGFKWGVMTGRKTFYARRQWGPRFAVTTVLMHHEVVGIPPNDFVVDHINNNGLDNRRSNLRIISHRDNLMRADRIVNAKGITKHYNKFRVRWRGAELGSFYSEEEAKQVLEAHKNAI